MTGEERPAIQAAPATLFDQDSADGNQAAATPPVHSLPKPPVDAQPDPAGEPGPPGAASPTTPEQPYPPARATRPALPAPMPPAPMPPAPPSAAPPPAPFSPAPAPPLPSGLARGPGGPPPARLAEATSGPRSHGAMAGGAPTAVESHRAPPGPDLTVPLVRPTPGPRRAERTSKTNRPSFRGSRRLGDSIGFWRRLLSVVELVVVTVVLGVLVAAVVGAAIGGIVVALQKALAG